MSVKSKEEFTCNALTLEVVETSDDITVRWLGKSGDRDPAKFIGPVLARLLERAGDGARRVVLDFQQLLYLNSSTITPIIRVLDEARKGSHRITVNYQRSIKWQDLSFSALQMFKTPDDRVQIRGL